MDNIIADLIEKIETINVIDKDGLIDWSKEFRTVEECSEYIGIGERHMYKFKAGTEPISDKVRLAYIKHTLLKYQKEKMI